MRRPAVRWSVLVLAVAAAAGCCYWAATLEREALVRRRALSTATADGRALQASLADARRALSAMASPGQAAVSWSRQATASIDSARTRLGALASLDGGAMLRPLSERFDRLAEAERRVRENAVGGRGLMASDLAFGEALPHVDAIDSAVADAVSTMTATNDRVVAALRDTQLLAIAGALAALGLAALVLTPIGGLVEAAAITAEVTDAPAGASHAVDDGLSPRPQVEAAVDVPADVPRAPWATPAAPTVPLPVERAAPRSLPAPDLLPLAQACDALAGLADGDQLPAALETARQALGARGVVVWLVNVDRTALSVVASAGYDRRRVSRFPTTSVSDTNPTARAFASGTPSSTLPGPGQPAALAVAIGGARGRTGVLSAELMDDAVADAQVVARARIVAAQLATLLEPAPHAEPTNEVPVVARAEEA